MIPKAASQERSGAPDGEREKQGLHPGGDQDCESRIANPSAIICDFSVHSLPSAFAHFFGASNFASSIGTFCLTSMYFLVVPRWLSSK